MIELAYPWVLTVFPLPWLVWRTLPAYRNRQAALRAPFFRRIAAAVGSKPRRGSTVLARRRMGLLALTAVWILLVLALARPERVGEPIEITKAARDLVLAIDLSGSMDVRDFKSQNGEVVQRLEAVKRVVGDFIEKREGDRIALIVFGAKAFVQAPFTEDLQTVRALLDQTMVGVAGPHTVIGDAIGLAIRTFEASDIEQRVLILLSDGADTGSRMTPRNAAAIAAQNGVEIYTIGVGDPNASGDSRVDLKAMREIASIANGAFFTADDEEGLSVVYDRIDALTPRDVDVISFRNREPLTHLLLGPAALIALMALAWLHFSPMRTARA